MLPILSTEVLAKLADDDVRQLLILNTKFTLLSTVNQSLDCKRGKIVKGLKEVVVQKGGSPEKLDKHLSQYSELLEGFIRNYEEVVVVFKSLNKKADANEVLDKIRTHLSDSKVKERIAGVQKSVKALLDEPAPKEEPKNAALKHAMDLIKRGGLENSKTVRIALGGKERVVGDVAAYKLRERVVGIEHELAKPEPKDAVIAKVLGVPKNELEEYLKMRLNMSKEEHIQYLTNILEIDFAEIEIKRYEKLVHQLFSLYDDFVARNPKVKEQFTQTPKNVYDVVFHLAIYRASVCSDEKPKNYIGKFKLGEPKGTKFSLQLGYCLDHKMPSPSNVEIPQTAYTGDLRSDLRTLLEIEIELAKHMQRLEIYYGINAADFGKIADLLEDYLADFDTDYAEKKKFAATLLFIEEADDPKVVRELREKVQTYCSMPIDFNWPVFSTVLRTF
ncbi:hypothetical protein BNJ_00400 [Kaumoebavirus]|uniref:hypothetical protein n=1 Tax=Kaumoebavirus TaxID=1859492 RepID=UPI0009C3CE81|nr:hypothetical protein BNJ_00400 [Kaumoebavirus]ARA72218.1 hypothetical protein BNJ_00400 [Kaumoebavirus]